jgi:hypothetical protein
LLVLLITLLAAIKWLLPYEVFRPREFHVLVVPARTRSALCQDKPELFRLQPLLELEQVLAGLLGTLIDVRSDTALGQGVPKFHT